MKSAHRGVARCLAAALWAYPVVAGAAEEPSTPAAPPPRAPATAPSAAAPNAAAPNPAAPSAVPANPAPPNAPPPPSQGGERLGVDDVLRLAATHPSLTAARARASGAEEQAKSARGRLLPVLSVHDDYQHWDSPFAVGFGPQVFVARKQDTNTFTAAASQPLLGLLERVQAHAARVSQADASNIQTEVAWAGLREEIETQYLQLFEARALRQIAQASQAELAQQVSNAEVKVKAGTLTNADLLRVQVALSNARQQEIVAMTSEKIARASLLSAIGRSPEDTSVEFQEPTRLLEQSTKQVDPASLTPERRPEVRAAELEADAAHHEERARFYALLPEIDVNAAYQRTDGQVFAPKNAAFVGVRADWPIFEWGATSAAHSAAEQAEVAARSNVESERRRAQQELTVRRAQLMAADSAVGLARESLGSAQEAYRVTEAVVRVGSGTTTDLLDAQSSLTLARLTLARNEYERAIAYVQLERATGATTNAPSGAR